MAEGTPPTSEDVVEVTVPPFPSEQAEFVDDQQQEIDLVALADYVREHSGQVGGIGVAIDVLQALTEDLEHFSQSGARPGELEFHATTLEEVLQLLTETASAEIESFDGPVYDPSEISAATDRAPNCESTDSLETETFEDAVARVRIDRISSSSNIIAEPIGLNTADHIHVLNGELGASGFAFHPSGELGTKSSVSSKPYFLPAETVEEAKEMASPMGIVPLKEGQLIQFTSTDEDRIAPLRRFGGWEFDLDMDLSTGRKYLCEIESIEGDTVSVTTERNQPITSTKRSTNTSQKNSNRHGERATSGSSLTKITDDPLGSKNDLITDKKL